MKNQEIKITIRIKIKSARRALCRGLWALLILTACHKQSLPAPPPPQTFLVNGLVKELELDGKTVVIQREAVSNYMAAMTMPFQVRDPKELRGLKPGDAISFPFHSIPKTTRRNACSVTPKAPITIPPTGVFSPATRSGSASWPINSARIFGLKTAASATIFAPWSWMRAAGCERYSRATSGPAPIWSKKWSRQNEEVRIKKSGNRWAETPSNPGFFFTS